MRQRSSLTLGLAWTAALGLLAPSAADARPKKPAGPAAVAKGKKKKTPAEVPVPSPAEAPPEPAPEAPASEPEVAPPNEAKESMQAPSVTNAAVEPPPAVERPQSPSLDAEPITAEEATLGRREARRVASGRVLVAVWAAAGVANRRFTYRDAVGNQPADYRLPVAPMASFGIEAYPAASSDVPVLRDLGIVARVSRGFAFDSKTPQGVALETSWTRFGGELRERLLWPGRHAFELGILLGADASYFGMTAKGPVPALLPAARTVALRFGFDARLKIAWGLSVLTGASYLLTTARGEIYDRFRDPSVQGVDADLGFGVDLGAGFEARLNGRYTRYFASFEPKLGDRYVAGGALDEQLQAGLGVRYAH